MVTICIIDVNTNRCINKLSLTDESQWRDHAHFKKSPRNDGEIGWMLLPNGEWDKQEIVASHEQLCNFYRDKRNRLLAEYVDKINIFRWELLTEAEKDLWRKYRQDLLDVPQQEEFPNNIVWPSVP
jgi:hypothetical protein